MTENSDKQWYAMSDKALMQVIGSFVKATRLDQNKTQQQVAEAAGMARSTVVNLENGVGGTLLSFIQLMRTLEQLHLFRQFEVHHQLSPLQLAKIEMSRRVRARHKKNNK